MLENTDKSGGQIGDGVIREAMESSYSLAELKLLSGYRMLEWGESESDSDLKVVMGIEGVKEGKIWFRNDLGRTFFVASAQGTEGLERLLSSGLYGGVKVSGVEFEQDFDLKSEIVLFDIDGTLRDYKDERSTGSKGIACMQALDQRGIRVGVWSRNSRQPVDKFTQQVETDAGVDVLPIITFDNWPFIKMRKGPGLSRYLFEPSGVDEIRKAVDDRIGEDGLSETDRQKLSQRISQLVGKIGYNSDLDEVLEAKAPVMAGLSLDYIGKSTQKSLIEGGVIVNDNGYTLGSVLSLGFSFIHLNSPDSLDKVPDLV